MSLLNVVNRPTSDCDPTRIHIGPTSPDFSMLAPTGPSPKEQAMLKQWKQQDLASYYRDLRGNRYR